MNHCKDCKYWDLKTKGLLAFVERPEGYGLCQLSELSPAGLEPLMTAVDVSEYHAGLFTSPRFGCVEFVASPAKEAPRDA